MSANKRRGTEHETAIVRYLNEEFGLYVPGWKERKEPPRFKDPRSWRNIFRKVQDGARDQGDIHAWPCIIEAKDEAKHDIPGYIRQANREAVNAGFPYGVSVVKKRRGNIKDAYTVLDLETFSRILRKLRECDGSSNNP